MAEPATSQPRVYVIRRASEPEMSALMKAWHPEFLVFGPYAEDQNAARDLSVTLPGETVSKHFRRFDLSFLGGDGGKQQTDGFAYAASWAHLKQFMAKVMRVQIVDMKELN